MFHLELNQNYLNLNLDSNFDNSARKKISTIINSQEIHLIGNIFEKDIESKLRRIFIHKEDIVEVLHEVFTTIYGRYTLVIRNNTKTLIASSYDMPTLYVYDSNSSSELVISDIHPKFSNKNIDCDMLYGRLHNGSNSICPISLDVISTIIPGMWMEIDNNIKSGLKINEGWSLPIKHLSSRSDHEDIANELAVEMGNVLKKFSSNTDYEAHVKISGGIDSALIAAAAKSNNIDVKYTNHFHHYLNNDSYHAYDISRKLGIKVNILPYQITHHSSVYYDNSDWEEYIKEIVIPLAKKNIFTSPSPGGMSLTLPFIRQNVFAFEGNTYPVNLCVQHCNVYPQLNLIKEFYLKIKQRKRRNQYSHNKSLQLLRYKTKSIAWLNDKIHPYYNYAFSMIFDKKNLSTDLEKCFEKKNKLLHPYYKKYLIIISNKIRKDKTFARKLLEPDANTMLKLIKLIAFIDGPAKGSGAVIKNCNGFETFNIGLASQITFLLLSVKFDELLIHNSKWHIFRAFQILTNLSFKKIYRKCLWTHLADHLLANIKETLSKFHIIRERYEKNLSHHNELLKNETNLEFYFKYLNIRNSKLLKIFEGTKYYKNIRAIYDGFDKDKLFLYRNIDYGIACSLVDAEIFLEN